ncbi:MAG: hypothetical protein ACYTGN_07240 [Planctomycetota bacterium]|jgi:hypothetical protein
MKTLFAFLLALAVAGCGGEHEHSGDGCGEGAHDHSPHDGTLLDLGDHEGHLEVVLDHGSGTATIWLSTPERKDLKAEEAPVFSFVADGKPKQVTGKGSGAKWVFTDEALKGEPEKAKFRVKANGTTYTTAFDHAH